ncbi:MAG: hypothetical protein KAS32_15375, partial [Candidatus Peribacteraceae bacterium]|nr:hypothetical protein [Candidatus Peribacteraceae bacterium]
YFPSSFSSFLQDSNNSTYNLSTMCSDSDQTVNYPTGMNQQKKGIAVNHLMPEGSNKFTDECISKNQLYEYHCNENGFLQRTVINCPISCESGACNIENISSESSSLRRSLSSSSLSSSSISSSSISSEEECTDTDANSDFINGRNPNKKGYVFGYIPDGRKLKFGDECMNMAFLREYTCGINNLVDSEYITCEFGCSDGKCLYESNFSDPTSSSSSSPASSNSSYSSQIACTDTDSVSPYTNGINPFLFGVTLGYSREGYRYDQIDTCNDSYFLKEFYCGESNIIKYTEVPCEFGCENGRCMENRINVCGNGIVEIDNGELCDDGNKISSDGCSYNCIIENRWQCFGDPSTCIPINY